MKKGFESLQILEDFRENSAGKVACLETSDCGQICGVPPKLPKFHSARTRCAVPARINVRAGTGKLFVLRLRQCGWRADAATGGKVDGGAVRGVDECSVSAVELLLLSSILGTNIAHMIIMIPKVKSE